MCVVFSQRQAQQLGIACQDGVVFGNQTGLVVVDMAPFVGNFLEGFLLMTQNINIACKYVPIHADPTQQEWFETFWMAELATLFGKGELRVPNMCRPAD